MHEIVLRNEKHYINPETNRGNRNILRGLYYLSPFVRDFQNYRRLIDYFETLIGEPLIPHCLFMNAPHVNISLPSKKAPLDPWHWDSVAYTGVIILNDMKGFQGGDLELMKMDKKLALKVKLSISLKRILQLSCAGIGIRSDSKWN